MKRRDFLGAAFAAGGALLPGAQARESDSDIKQVLVMFKCHFDLGFIDTQAGVMRKYFGDYFPRAIQIAKNMRDAGADRYVWTTGSWLLYEYL